MPGPEIPQSTKNVYAGQTVGSGALASKLRSFDLLGATPATGQARLPRVFAFKALRPFYRGAVKDVVQMDGGSEKGSPRKFPNSLWTDVIDPAGAGDSDALNRLFEMYRTPLEAYLRACRYSPHDAEELVQSLFVTLLRRDFLKNVGREKGRFRTFLKVCLKHHLADQRNPPPGVSLQDVDENGQPRVEVVAPDLTPDNEIDRWLAEAIVRKALRLLEEECARSGHQALCVALVPVMYGDETSLSYRQIAKTLGMSEGAVKVAAHRIRRRFRGILRQVVRQTVTNKEDLEDEIRYLMGLFGRR